MIKIVLFRCNVNIPPACLLFVYFGYEINVRRPCGKDTILPPL